MIAGYCKTNLDEAKKFNWPTSFVSVPKLGDYVRACEAKFAQFSKLKVCSITHIMVKVYRESGAEFDEHGARFDWEPRVEIELNK